MRAPGFHWRYRQRSERRCGLDNRIYRVLRPAPSICLLHLLGKITSVTSSATVFIATSGPTRCRWRFLVRLYVSAPGILPPDRRRQRVRWPLQSPLAVSWHFSDTRGSLAPHLTGLRDGQG